MGLFQLHAQLSADTVQVCDLPLCRVRLMNDQRFPWLILVPMREGLRELVDLVPGDQALMLTDINRVSRVLQQLFTPDKLNVAALGNMVPQLHIHVIARFQHDAAWPKPIWGVGEPKPYPDIELKGLVQRIAAMLQAAAS
jgi:diadenosine tetraphosphate (Ap4A) HIT family hydrolase